MNTISDLINSFKKLHIQSEAEVRSKLIVPLLELLGYPTEYRAEEFPVYGCEGGKELRAKPADFILFTSNEFASNRDNTREQKEWVYNHSLLVFEAKKPTESVSVLGQPVYYSVWTKSIAYIISNGKVIEGYLVNANYSDTCVFSCKVEDAPSLWDTINQLNYQNMCIKKAAAATIFSTKEQLSVFNDYKKTALVRCARELHLSLDRTVERIEDEIIVSKSGIKNEYTDLLDKKSVIITGDPGCGKSFLTHMLLRDFIIKYGESDEIIPVRLEGKYFKKAYSSIVNGIEKELCPVLPTITEEMVRNRLNNGGFAIIIDALDEISCDPDELYYEIIKLRENTDITMVLTFRSQNYHGEFPTLFEHYSLEPLSDDQVQELLDKNVDRTNRIFIHNLPKRLVELIRVPLFLKMYISVSKSFESKNLRNYTGLFEMFFSQRMVQLHCSPVEKGIILNVLQQYAEYSFENGDNTDCYSHILVECCSPQNQAKITELIWKSGIILDGAYGIAFFHKAMQEFFYARFLSEISEVDLEKWLNERSNDEHYYEIICYLTGIISNKHMQNIVLDYLEVNNLYLYVKALNARRNFGTIDQTFNYDYAYSYFTQVLNSYKRIVYNHLLSMCYLFDGFRLDHKGTVCASGEIDYSHSTISITFFDGQENNSLSVSLSSENTTKIIAPNNMEIPVTSSVFKSGSYRVFSYSLELTSYGFDSAREIALDIVKHQLKEILNNKQVFDFANDALLIERIEITLAQLHREISNPDRNEKISLYNRSLSDVCSLLEKNEFNNNELESLKCLCQAASARKTIPNDFLLCKPDLPYPKEGCLIDEVYSDNQLLNRIKQVIDLTNRTVYEIVNGSLPVLQSVYKPSYCIGVICRQKDCLCLDGIKVQTKNNPIVPSEIELSDHPIRSMPTIDEYYKNRLTKLNKTERDITSSFSSDIYPFLRENVLHERTYQAIKQLFKTLFERF